ncbi:MAG: phosphoribosyltransferase domain-containing protein [Clostridiales bacterium]|nr:phosphoribosyltransferase domain-containing protein [Clostridiales bacterium]
MNNRDSILQQMISVAKRDRNKKRPYLIVNPLQGKHMPIAPSVAIHLFGQLAEKINAQILGQNTVVISFAETATAIGACAASLLRGNPMYLQTTRESCPEAEYIYFSESHSHATEQKIIKNGFVQALTKAEEIVFIEDEITTGNTILGLKEELDRFTKNVRYTAASLLNGMTEDSLERFQKKGIAVVYLGKSDNGNYEKLLGNYRYDGKEYIAKMDLPEISLKRSVYSGYVNPRWIHPMKEYEEKCHQFATQFSASHDIKEGENILILGTEEFMYPALLSAYFLEKQYPLAKIRFHATTRSPILPSSEASYPIFSRSQLISPYEEERITYVYNLCKYDKVFLITEAEKEYSAGINTIVDALYTAGNTKIEICRWCEK